MVRAEAGTSLGREPGPLEVRAHEDDVFNITMKSIVALQRAVANTSVDRFASTAALESSEISPKPVVIGAHQSHHRQGSATTHCDVGRCRKVMRKQHVMPVKVLPAHGSPERRDTRRRGDGGRRCQGNVIERRRTGSVASPNSKARRYAPSAACSYITGGEYRAMARQ